MRTAVVSAADARYGNWLINLVGSIRRRSNIFDRIVVYDLGLTRFQRRLLDGTRGVDVRTVPSFVPHWRQGRTWKTWVWTNVEAESIVWLDAGITVLRSLHDFLTQIEQRGYFVVSQGVPNRECIPSDYYSLYDFPHSRDDDDTIAAGILGFAVGSEFYSRVIVPTYEDAVAGRSLGFSASEVEKLNRGLDRMAEPVVRDCRLFRHEQTLLSIHFYRTFPSPVVNDLQKYGGFRTPRDHPEQVIWSHRRRGDFRFLPRVPYRPATALVGVPWGTAVYLKMLFLNYRWLFRPSFHAHLARRIRDRLPRR
jgi:hypothetical protein